MINRILFSDNGTITDKTKELNNYHADEIDFSVVDSEDFLYISSVFPFNHIYMDITGAASTAMSYTISIWDGTTFKDVVDTIDETNGLTQAGFITWTPDQDEGWSPDDTEDIAELSTVKIYQKYWIKLSFTSTNDFSLNWLGNLFSNDDDLNDMYPDLNSTQSKASFGSGKTDWKEQHIVVARDIINKLRSRGTIIDRSQILERRQLIPPAVHHLAELIFTHFGDAFRDQRDDAKKTYTNTLNEIKLVVDKSGTAIPKKADLVPSTGGELYR